MFASQRSIRRAGEASPETSFDRLLPRRLRHVSLFWRLQLLGWGGFGLVSFYAFSVYFEVYAAGELILYEATRMTIACGLTLLLRPFYHRLWAGSASFPIIGLASLSGSLACGVGLLIGFRLAFMRWVNPLSRADDTSTYPKSIVDYSLIFLAWSALYFGIKYWRDLQTEHEHTLQAHDLARQAQLQMLRYQLNPHFLFNSLTSIHALISEDPDRAEEMVEELSDFLRSSLLSDQVTQATLSDEVRIIRSYLTIEKLRFEDKLDVDFSIDPRSEKILLPSFIVHPLVENAVKHGMKASAKPLRIRLTTMLEEGALEIRVSNSGAWKTPPPDETTRGAGEDREVPETTGIGLANVHQRLVHSYPEAHRFEIREEAGWVHATISIEAPGVRQ